MSRVSINLRYGFPLKFSAVDRQKTQERIAAHGTPQQVALRCRILLGAADGEADSAISRRLLVNRGTVIVAEKVRRIGAGQFVGCSSWPGQKTDLRDR